MRIVAGKHRSRTLFTPQGNDVRPTSDKTRQAIFNILNSRGLVVDAVVVDAFCGTGALGLEALSQGASFSIFFDKARDSVALCKKNAELLREEENSYVGLMDVTKIRPRPDNIKPATLVFLDPPYHQNLVLAALEALKNGNWLAEKSCFIIETAKDEIINCPLILVELEKIYGDTKIILGTLK